MTKTTTNYSRGELTRVVDGVNSYFLFKIELDEKEKLIFGEAVLNSEGTAPRWMKINQNSCTEKVKELLYVGTVPGKTGHRVEIKTSCWDDNLSFAVAVSIDQNKIIEIVIDQNRLEHPIKTLILS